MHNMSQMKCISDVITEYAFQITRPSVTDYVAEILEEDEVQRRHHSLKLISIEAEVSLISS